MNCHRLEHSNQGLAAPGDCDLCHPKNFNLIPKDHTDNFKQASHSVVAANSKNQSCLNCHKGEFCRSCHISKGITDPEDAFIVSPVLRQPKNRKWKKITLGSMPVEMAKCKTCHTDLQLWKNPKLINFNHPVHFKRNIRCGVCHTEWPHQVDKVVKPLMYTCAQCHRLTHSNQGLAAPGECGLCHPATMKLKPDFHTVEFVGGDHKTLAKQDRGLCRTCHRQSFCDNCHQLNADLIPHPPGWKTEHGTVAGALAKGSSQSSFVCFNCHKPEGPQFSYQSAPSCAKCHKAVVYPHQQPWAPKHGKTAVKTGKDVCYTCHKSEVFCNGCHNGITMPHNRDTWIGQHRLYLRDNPIDKCLDCHEKRQCLQCHKTHKVHKSHEIYDFGELKR